MCLTRVLILTRLPVYLSIYNTQTCVGSVAFAVSFAGFQLCPPELPSTKNSQVWWYENSIHAACLWLWAAQSYYVSNHTCISLLPTGVKIAATLLLLLFCSVVTVNWSSTYSLHSDCPLTWMLTLEFEHALRSHWKKLLLDDKVNALLHVKWLKCSHLHTFFVVVVVLVVFLDLLKTDLCIK